MLLSIRLRLRETRTYIRSIILYIPITGNAANHLAHALAARSGGPLAQCCYNCPINPGACPGTHTSSSALTSLSIMPIPYRPASPTSAYIMR